MKTTQLIAIILPLIILMETVSSSQEVLSRDKRFLFPQGSDIGVLVAIAVPLDLPHRSVFVSYNFETNYSPPTMASDIIPGPLKFLELIDRRGLGRKNGGGSVISVTEPYNKSTSMDDEERGMKDDFVTTEVPEVPKVTKSPHKRYASDSLLTRKKVYKMLESRLQNHGLRGRACLLRAVCESSEGPIHELTGVLGDVIHIILT
ncbi:uncharacterized protein LOC132265262 [Phlebotomus argentipes]|uniref:uncharacterized protein LOC132265262 n=1 Tax=Phlebotomus argentipes TaxID=94469 RepID=UPI002892F97E|nr:uncharacterized protein LOC132265262 [Phlebotomus argentipes]